MYLLLLLLTLVGMTYAKGTEFTGFEKVIFSEDLRDPTEETSGKCPDGERFNKQNKTCLHIAFRAHGKNDTSGVKPLVTASLEHGAMKQEGGTCGDFAKKKHQYNFHQKTFVAFKYEYECFEGQYTYNRQFDGLYTCEFGEKSGRLFVQSFKRDGHDRCVSTVSNASHTGTHSFRVHTLRTRNNPVDEPAIYAEDDKLWLRASAGTGAWDCQVTGFYCVIETVSRDMIYESKDLRPEGGGTPKSPNCTDARVMDATTDTCTNMPFRAYNEDGDELTTQSMEAYYMKHDVERCKTVNSERVWSFDGLFSHEWECFEGSFDVHSVHQGIYTCDFGNKPGRLFVQSYRDEKHCKDVMSTSYHTGVHSFLIERLHTEWTDGGHNRSLYASKNEIRLRSSAGNIDNALVVLYSGDCWVRGLACMEETALPWSLRPPPQTTTPPPTAKPTTMTTTKKQVTTTKKQLVTTTTKKQVTTTSTTAPTTTTKK